MNKERLLELAEHLEQVPHMDDLSHDGRGREKTFFDMYNRLSKGAKIQFFNMRSYCFEDECGTAGCIAGHAAALFTPKDYLEAASGGWSLSAKKALGLTGAQADALFYVPTEHGDAEDATPEDAANACRRLAAGVPLKKLWGH